MSNLEKHMDPNHEYNSSTYHTRKKCIEDGCDKPAGTAWSPYWCWECHSKRLNRITGNLIEAINSLER